MMLTILLPTLLVLAAALAVSAMIATWLHYGGAWDGVAAEIRKSKSAQVSYVTVGVMSAEQCLAPLPVPVVRARPPVGRSRNGRRVAA